MGILGVTAHVLEAKPEAEAAIFYFSRGRAETYALVTGIPRSPAYNLRAYAWMGGLDELGACRVKRVGEGGAAPQSLLVDVRAHTVDRSLAQWLLRQAPNWQPAVFNNWLAGHAHAPPDCDPDAAAWHLARARFLDLPENAPLSADYGLRQRFRELVGVMEREHTAARPEQIFLLARQALVAEGALAPTP